MSNPQSPGKQGRKDAKAKAPQPHQTGAPGRSEHQQHGQSTRPQSEHGHTQHRSHPQNEHGHTQHRSQPSERERENMEEEE
jgi:hypothetical protein